MSNGHNCRKSKDDTIIKLLVKSEDMILYQISNKYIEDFQTREPKKNNEYLTYGRFRYFVLIFNGHDFSKIKINSEKRLGHKKIIKYFFHFFLRGSYLKYNAPRMIYTLLFIEILI